MSTIRFHLFDTAMGAFALAWTDVGVAASQLPEADPEATRARLLHRRPAAVEARPQGDIDALVRAVQLYAEGKPVSFDHVTLDLRHVLAGDRTIYEALRRVGYGTLVTYGELAAACGAAGGARSVGQAMARNPIPLIIPCHRVVGAGGKLVGFSGGGGTDTKARMLRMEDAQPAALSAQGRFAF